MAASQIWTSQRLAVTEEAIGVVTAVLHPGGRGHAGGNGQPATERPAAEVDPGDLAHVGMISKGAAEPGVAVEEGWVEISRGRRERGRGRWRRDPCS